MAKVFHFPQQVDLLSKTPFKSAMMAIEKRLGVPFEDYIGVNGKRTVGTQAKIDKALQKETF